jgi:hypothetical protein
MPLAQLAEETGVAVLAVRHLNKQGGKPAMYRGGGSIAMIGTARTAMLVGKDPSDPDVRVLACTKANLGPKPKAWKYQIISKGFSLDGGNFDVGTIQWLGVADVDADDLVAESAEKDKSAVGKAVEFLKALLEKGPVPATEVYALGKKDGHKESTLRRAATLLGVVKKQKHDGKIAGWEWSLAVQGVAQAAEKSG